MPKRRARHRSKSEEAIATGSDRSYIDNQKTHHAEQALEDEYLSLLAKHGVEFDPQYLRD